MTNVLHPDHGSGELLTQADGTAYVDFKRAGKLEVPVDELRKAPPMLLHNEIEANPEWADAEPHEGEEPIYGGQATIDLLFNNEHDIGVDVDTIGFENGGEDGTYRIVVQYWLEDDLKDLEDL